MLTRTLFPVAVAATLLLTGLMGDPAHAAKGKSNLSTKRYTGARRLSKAANGAGAFFLNKDKEVVKALGTITSRRVKVTELGTKKSATGTNTTFRVETIKKVNGIAAASVDVVVADFTVKGPRGGKTKVARFFQRKNARVQVFPFISGAAVPE